MSDRILYLALGVSVLGLLILTYVSEVIEPPVSRIGDINSNSIGKDLRVQGSVSGLHRFKGGSVLLTVADGTGNISVYLDYSMAMSMPNISKARVLDVVGEIDEYEGALELKPKRSNGVRVLS
jgi:RecJ-like exonuclease